MEINKNILLFILFVLVQNVMSQNYDSLEQSDKVNLKTLKKNEFNKMLFNSKKEYKIIYFFDTNCASSIKFENYLKNIYTEHKKNVDFFIVVKGNEKDKDRYYEYLFFYEYYFPVYLLSENQNQIVKGICDECNAKKMGYSDFIILDRNNMFLAQSNYNLKENDKVLMINKVIK